MSVTVLLAYGLFVAIVSLQPADGSGIDPWDKLLHFITYAIFAMLARRAVGGEARFLSVCLGIVAYSGFIEVAQSWMPGRVMSGFDLLANALGVAAGAAIGKRMDHAGAGR